MQELRDKLAEIENDLRAEKDKGANADQERVAELEKQYQECVNQINDAQIEEKVNAEAIPFAVAGVDLSPFPVELIGIIEKIVRADRKRLHREHAEEMAELQSMYEFAVSESEKWAEDVKVWIQRIRDCEAAALERAHEIDRIKLELKDMTSKRDAAVTQLTEAQAEIERLKSEIDDYQKAKAFGEREAQNIIDVEPNDAEEINKAIKQFVSYMDYGTLIRVDKPDGTFEAVKRTEFENEWVPLTPPSLPIEGGSESNESFLGPDPAETDAGHPEANQEVVPPVSQFQTEVEGATTGLVDDTAVHEGDGETFEEEVRRRLDDLESAVFARIAS